MRLDLGLVVCEATGKWHRPLWRSLHASGLPIAVVDGYRVRMFARAQGIFAKTDRLDAAVLSAFAATMNPAIRPPAPEILEELAELNAARDSAVAEQTSLKNQLSAARTAYLRRQLPQRIKALAKVIEALESEIMARLQADEGLARRYAILTSIPSIGFAVAATLIARLAELGSLPDKQIAMLAGLAPIADQSGDRDGQRVIWGGRARVRRMLYLAAVSAVRCNAAMKAFYQRLRDAGKPPKVALIAVARKLALLANALIEQDRTWQTQAPNHA
jgi:transposase